MGPVVNQLVRIAEVEDGRGRHGRGLELLFPLVEAPDSIVRAAAVRALGRQQSPALLGHIYPRLRDRAVSVRREAVNAVGQALQGSRDGPADAARALVAAAVDSLSRVATARGGSTELAGVAARTLGRLPYRDSAAARAGEASILRLLGELPPEAREIGQPRPLLEGALHGLYSLARARRTTGAVSTEGRTTMQRATAFGRHRRDASSEPVARVRRLALLGYLATGNPQPMVVSGALGDPDEQVRRLAMIGQAAFGDTAGRRAIVAAGLADRSALVRLEAVRAWRAFASSDGCAPLISALGDANAHVVLAAIDGLTASCRDRQRVTDTLLSLIDANRSDSPVRSAGRSGWHVHAHALVALARSAPGQALAVVRRDARESTLWTVRMYAARAAAALRDSATLGMLALDRNGNVRQEAVGGLAAVTGHVADRLFVGALDAPEYHVVMEAAQALRGAPLADSVVPALLQAMDRISAERRETSRDARMALLDRIEELGSPAHRARVEPYRSDFDSTVARRAAAVLEKWTGRQVAAAPRPLTLPREDLGPVMTGEWRARIIMAPTTGGGSFEVALFPREAPYTVARFIRLARAGYYDGLTLHRVEPAFVIQGGSPAANEYVGDGPFMRDELGLRSHARGTLGISTRGRDTGDAQLFVNLTDNFRLDHEYTVFGEISRGREVAEGILEGDVIARVEVVKVR
jgi:cyclophilin family peptidyl-prolyl cis-trans isomerase